MASIRFNELDRDENGFVKVAEPRSLADLLPKPAEIRKDATRQPWTRTELAGLAAVAVIAAFVLVWAWSTPTAPTAPAQARPTPIATVQATSVPTAAPATAVRHLPAFAAPDGITLGTIEATRPMTPTAHYGDEWIQAQVAGSGLIWLQAIDLPGVGLIGPDLAPPRPAPATQPVSAPAPPSCAEAGIPGKMVRVCDYAELSALEAQAKQQWLSQYGGNLGVISTPSPQVREP